MPKFTELPGASPPGPPPGLCPGPAGGLQCPQTPQLFFWPLWPRHYQNASDGPGDSLLLLQIKDLQGRKSHYDGTLLWLYETGKQQPPVSQSCCIEIKKNDTSSCQLFSMRSCFTRKRPSQNYR